jgi:predicted phosphate transport protein (TIGR00153 family)
MLGWFHALLPREERFFELFAGHSHAVVAGAKALRAMLEGGDAVPNCYREVMDREHEADNFTRDILIAARRTFITPFDRGDVKDLITAMDNAIDQMQKTAKAVMLFNLRSFTPQMREMGDAVVKCALLVEEAMPLLRRIGPEAGRLSTISEQISRLEGQADEMHDQGLKELFETHGASNPMAFITGNEVYDHLEKVVDRFDDVANEIQGVVLDHA